MRSGVDSALRDRILWLAGLFDGEGHISLFMSKNQLVADVAVTNTDLAIINEVRSIADALGLSYNVRRSGRKDATHHKPCFQVAFCGLKRARRFLREIVPYLVGKRSRAEAVLTFIEYRQRTMDNRAAFGPRSKPRDDMWLMQQLDELRTERQKASA